ncbi:MAG: hypothetical protein AMXMBFR23_22720 [Chloroflexota bacterium]
MNPWEWTDTVASSGMSRRGSALVISPDPRTGVALALFLQEMDLAVDLGHEAGYAARWMRHARYDLAILDLPSTGDEAAAVFAQVRALSPETRFLVLGDPDARLRGAEVLPRPLQVNDLARMLLPD